MKFKMAADQVLKRFSRQIRKEDAFSLIKETFGSAICPANESFWDACKQSAVATLILVSKVAAVSNVQFKKRDRRGWIVF